MEKNLFDQPVKSNLRTYDNIWKIVTGPRDDYRTGLMDYNYFNKHYKMIAIDLSKQQAFDADRKPIQQIIFTWNLNGPEGATMLFIIEEAKIYIYIYIRFFTKNCESIVTLFCFNIISTWNDSM